MDCGTIDVRIGVSVMEASRLLGIGRTKTYELLNSGTLRARKIGRRTVISTASIRELIDGAREPNSCHG